MFLSSKTSIRRWAATLILASVSATGFAATPLFEDGNASTTEFALTPKQHQVFLDISANGHTTRMRSAHFSGAMPAKAAQLQLNLLDDADFLATSDTVTVNSAGRTLWSGHIMDDKGGEPGFVNLVFNGDNVFGNIRHQGRWLAIRPLGNGEHAIAEFDEGMMPEEHPVMADEPVAFDTGALDPLAISAPADKTIKVLVAYTPSAKSAAGDINAMIDLAIQETNNSYANSGIEGDIAVELAYSYQVDYNESGNFSTDLKNFREPGDGIMDEVHSLRDTYGADVAVIIIKNSSYCGLASGHAVPASKAFVAVHHSCATGYYSFAHEIGHLQGARHDIDTDGSTYPYAYGHGYQEPGGAFRTIMAYNCSGGCPRLPYWSNPGVTYGGKAMGKSSTAHNARVMQESASYVAGFRSGGSTPPPAPVDAAFGFSCNELACSFDAGASSGTISGYSWNFGDGKSATGSNPSHTFAGSGSYTVTLKVTGSSGATDSMSKTVVVSVDPGTGGGSDISLTYQLVEKNGNTHIDLYWDGMTGDRTDIWVNGDRVKNTGNDGKYRMFRVDPDYYEIRVCSEGSTSNCSDIVTVDLGDGSVTPPPPPASGELTLTSEVVRKNGYTHIYLYWEGAAGDRVDIHENGAFSRNTGNDGKFMFYRITPGVYQYKVCEEGSSVCSSEITVDAS